MTPFHLANNLIVALDVDTAEEAFLLAKTLKGRAGALKVGPRLCMRYGADLVKKLAEQSPVFVDNKYLDIPSTVDAAIRATFEAGATLATVHAWNGKETLARLAATEKELNQKRPFKILAVTILTSFSPETLPPGSDTDIANSVSNLAKLTTDSGLTGLVCSPHEVAALRKQNSASYLVTPGVRLADDDKGDQKRIETPAEAIRKGSSALVVGRPIIAAADPVAAADRVIASINEGLRPWNRNKPNSPKIKRGRPPRASKPPAPQAKRQAPRNQHGQRTQAGATNPLRDGARWVVGIHSCEETLLVRPKKIREIWLRDDYHSSEQLRKIADMADKHKVKIEKKTASQLEQIAPGHQGVALATNSSPEVQWGELKNDDTKQIVLILDGLEDPHNLGSILRTAWLTGVKAIFIPEDRAVGLTPTVNKIASGGAEHVPVEQDTNLANTMQKLKDAGFWIYGLSEKGKRHPWDFELPKKVAWVVGNEGSGMRITTERACDELVRIPQVESGSSYNASIALAMALTDTVRQLGLPG